MVTFLRAMAAVVDPHYPQMNATIYVVRAPRGFAMLWGLVKAFMPRGVEEKLKIYSTLPLDVLSSEMPPEALPAFLGGTSPVILPVGGYMTVSRGAHSQACQVV